MRIFPLIKDLRAFLDEQKAGGKRVGFVPTMGALHEGHLSLMRQAKAENDLLVVSIFVNPIQFNNPEDLKKYPRDVEGDKKLLESVGCDALFLPSEDEMYPEPVTKVYDFGDLANVMEGVFRPGHFNGVAVVVHKLFDIVQPDRAYFGEKDFQQLAIIKKMVQMENIPVEIIPCPIMRESDGLAMSSRNVRLTPEQRKNAPFIYQTLREAQRRRKHLCAKPLQQMVINLFDANKNFRLEYFEIVDDQNLQPIQNWNEHVGTVACVAAWMGEVRLIDNIRII
ncbi:MAG: pantoate--beta-alanine ligase [Bacteroidales bacterium]|nr:pantoate--beta-alanine ligase [Bacteroidales bacterium]